LDFVDSPFLNDLFDDFFDIFERLAILVPFGLGSGWFWLV